MVAWKPAKRIDDVPCSECGRVRADHDPLGPHHFLAGALDEFTETEVNYAIRHETRRREGQYDVPLPHPDERRRIREAAGLTQEDLGDELEVSKDTVYRWEKEAVGYRGGERLPGREPSGKLRQDYAQLLQRLSKTTEDHGSPESS